MGSCTVDVVLPNKNQGNDLILKFVMLIQVYFRHAELWHSKPVIQYKCININIRVPRAVHTGRTTPVIYCKHSEV